MRSEIPNSRGESARFCFFIEAVGEGFDGVGEDGALLILGVTTEPRLTNRAANDNDSGRGCEAQDWEQHGQLNTSFVGEVTLRAKIRRSW